MPVLRLRLQRALEPWQRLRHGEIVENLVAAQDRMGMVVCARCGRILEREFMQLLLRSWAYACAYPWSTHRTQALIGWPRWYNRRRSPRLAGRSPARQPCLTPLWSVQQSKRTRG